MSGDFEGPDELSGPDIKEGAFRDNVDFYPVLIEGLNLGLLSNFDLYYNAGDSHFIVKAAGEPVTPEKLKVYKEKSHYLYLKGKDRNKYCRLLEDNIEKIVKSPDYDDRAKATALTDFASDIVDKLFNDPESKSTLRSARTFSRQAVNLITSNRLAFLRLINLSNHDTYTYAHSVGVATYCVALARDMGAWNEDQLADIGLAGLLHDIGKTTIPIEIINKPGPLSEDEWTKMKEHPGAGAQILRKHKELPDLCALIAEAHHEDLLGKGYPKGLFAQELDPLVNISTIADVFSALTTKRSYSPARESRKALSLMRESIGTKFDEDYFKKFVYLFLAPDKKAA